MWPNEVYLAYRPMHKDKRVAEEWEPIMRG